MFLKNSAIFEDILEKVKEKNYVYKIFYTYTITLNILNSGINYKCFCEF